MLDSDFKPRQSPSRVYSTTSSERLNTWEFLEEHWAKKKLTHKETNKGLYMFKDQGFREEKLSLESYGKRVVIRVYSFQAWGAPGCRRSRVCLETELL